MPPCRPRPPKGRSSSTLDVLTRDGEAFPVKRKLLRSCIALTAAVRSEAPGAAVDVDTLVFDRFTPVGMTCMSRLLHAVCLAVHAGRCQCRP